MEYYNFANRLYEQKDCKSNKFYSSGKAGYIFDKCNGEVKDWKKSRLPEGKLLIQLILNDITEFDNEREKLIVNEQVVKRILKHLSDNNEQSEFNLQDERNELFAQKVAGYQRLNQNDIITPITPALTPLMMGKISYSKIRKISLIPLVRAELQARGIDTDDKMKISDLIKLLKENKVEANEDQYFVPISGSIDNWN